MTNCYIHSASQHSIVTKMRITILNRNNQSFVLGETPTKQMMDRDRLRMQGLRTLAASSLAPLSIAARWRRTLLNGAVVKQSLFVRLSAVCRPCGDAVVTTPARGRRCEDVVFSGSVTGRARAGGNSTVSSVTLSPTLNHDTKAVTRCHPAYLRHSPPGLI